MCYELKGLIQSKVWFEGLRWWKYQGKVFEVLSKGEGQAMDWRSKNLTRVKKKVLAFSWGTNQAMMFMFMWRIKSHCSVWWKWLDTFEVNSHLLIVIKSQAQDGYAQEENQSWHVDTLTWWRLRAMAFGFEGNHLKRFKLCFSFNLELIGMSYYLERCIMLIDNYS